MIKKMIFFSILMSATAFAAISPKTKNATKGAIKSAWSSSAILRGGGAIHGGVAGRGFSLLSVQSLPSKNQKLERLTFNVGDPLFQAHQGAPGYFHIENSPEENSVVINFAQTYNAKFNEQNLQQVFAKSPFVKSSQMIFEPESQTMSLILLLKKQASIRAIPVAGQGQQTAQLKLDLFDDSLLSQKRKK
jgi:hypothetical protein